jgi:hypothetical protein
MKIKKSIIYSVVAFSVGFIYAFYKEPKPIESIGHVGLIVATTIGYMLVPFVGGSVILLLLMIFIKSIRKEFWNLSTLIMMGGIILFALTSLFS